MSSSCSVAKRARDKRARALKPEEVEEAAKRARQNPSPSNSSKPNSSSIQPAVPGHSKPTR